MFVLTRRSYSPSKPNITTVDLRHKKQESLVGTQDKKAAKELSAEELAAVSHEKPTSTTVVEGKCGRIRFEGIVVENKVTTLICEECEKKIAVVKCVVCDQVFCAICVDLCHQPVVEDQGLHPHEKLGPLKGMRPLRQGDTSKIKFEVPFEMPADILLEDDFGKHRDLSLPNALAADNLVVPQRSVQHYALPRYSVGEQLLFTDPVTGKEAYGRVLNEWDLRHGNSAPPVVRGDNSGVMYIMHLLGLVEDLAEGYSELVRVPPEDAPPSVLPNIEGHEDVPFRIEGYLAVDIDRKLADARSIQKYGPRNHMKSNFPELIPVVVQRDFAKAVDMIRPEPNDILETIPASKIYQHLQMHTNDNFSNPFEQPPLSQIEANPDSPRAATYRRYKHALKYAGSKAKRRERRNNGRSGDAFGNTQDDDLSSVVSALDDGGEVDEVDDGVSSDGSDVDRTEALKVYIVGENNLTRPIEKQQQIMKEKCKRVRYALERRFMNSFAEMQKWAFDIWVDNMDHLRTMQLMYMARRIQAVARTWFQRGTLRRLSDEWQVVLEQRWQAVHDQFGYTSRTDPCAVTMDKKIYFRTLTDLNRYAAFLIKVISKCAKFLERKRMLLLRKSIKKWAISCGFLSEGNIKASHILGYAEDSPSTEDMSPSALQQLFASKAESTAKFFKVGATMDLVQEVVSSDVYSKMKQLEDSTGEFSYDNVFSQGCGFGVGAGHRTVVKGESEATPTILDPNIPPTHPSVGITVPKLPKLYEPSTADERLTVGSDRLKYFGFRACAEGPSDASCWIIPGLLCMGGVPYGPARKNSSLESVAAIMLAGMGTFVSLLGEEEETQDMLRKNEKQSIYDKMKASFVKSKLSVSTVIQENEEVVEKYQKELVNLPYLPKDDTRYAKYKRERIRCNAKIQIAFDNISKTKRQLNKYPKQYELLRIPLSSSSAPTVHQLLVIMWELERRLRAGECLFVYSRDGHGRAGMICGALLGRLTGLTAREALYRLQACHDATITNDAMTVPVSCPQLPIQRQIVAELIDSTNRHFAGITWRSLTNPDKAEIEVHELPRGDGLGLLGRGQLARTVNWKKPVVRFRHESDIDSRRKAGTFDHRQSTEPIEKHPEAISGLAYRGGNSTEMYPIYADGNIFSGDLPATANTGQRRNPGGILQQRGISSGLVPLGSDDCVPVETIPITRPLPSGPPRLPLIRLLRTTGNNTTASVPFNIASDKHQ